jgi:hypothetical protein
MQEVLRSGTVALPMTQRLTTASGDRLAQLRGAAEQRAASLGHFLGPWTTVEEGVSYRATCTVCGRAVYARAEGALAGMAGRACGEPCD